MRKHPRIALPGLAAAVLILVPSVPEASAAPAVGEDVTVYVGSDGSSSADLSGNSLQRTAGNAGLSAQSPVGSLRDAQVVLAARHTKNATIMLRGGTYTDAGVEWAPGIASGTVTIKAQPGTGPVTFDGRAAKDGYWMKVGPTSPKLNFQGPYTVQRYGDGGIKATGTKKDGPVKGLVVNGITFKEIGNAWVEGGKGYAGVHLNYVSKAKITKNLFVNLENKEGRGNTHGVYLAFNQAQKTPGSNENLVQGNTFQVVSGDPVRAADGSSGNRVRNNVFKKGRDYEGKVRGNGNHGMFTYWVFPRADTCGSGGNTFSGNTYSVDYYNKKGSAVLSGSDTGRTCKSVKATGVNTYEP
ncbi:hypothetical protein [Embleya hyalina]|uniref:Right handed beta helix domain-containing protein n=1 Tax=Embleya hyalina TaxID=516124 RepID=A0A401YN78_9ACTN|nr:hypothetical protein [Embleya hyalina]GCD96072.1 hypothetical protein EHYA_03756 [Embleya hyalina]